MRLVFVDTHFLIATINRLDQWHRSAIQTAGELGSARLMVTESVLIETLNFFAEFRSEAKEHAAKTVENISTNPNIKVIDRTPELFHALILYKSRLDKGYSLTDCISMNVCREFGISEILTHDRHFQQEGFAILL